MTTVVASSGYPTVVTVVWDGGISIEPSGSEIFRGQNVLERSQATQAHTEGSVDSRIEQAPLNRRTRAEHRQKAKEKTHRKVRGILLGFFEEEAKVAFDDRGKPLEYWLPAKLLRKNGVTAENQPFELIEGEREIGVGFEFYTNIVPLAKPSASKLEPLPLNKSYKAKLKFILESAS